MVLAASRPTLERLSIEELADLIRARRAAIREHRDAKGDDRCWLDDYKVWGLVAGLPGKPSTAFRMRHVGMSMCEQFYALRRAEAADPIPSDALMDPARWDEDLGAMDRTALANELLRIQVAIIVHYRAIPKSADHDRALYALLPEKIPADFRLPPRAEFLEPVAPEAGCPAPKYGCPQFWDSHAKCDEGTCDLHQWGPCQ